MAKKKTAQSKLPLPDASLKKRARQLYLALAKLYPDAHCALEHRNAYELLVATILSAQCTDVRVNKVTPALFEQYPTPEKMAQANVTEIEELVRTTGFFRNKAKSIKGASEKICHDFSNQVPQTMPELLTLQGVARKTANVVLGNAFNQNIGVVVDTHVGRLTYRMGLTKQTDPKKIEQDLMQLITQKNWTLLSHLLIYHGRAICKARKPACDQCSLAKLCDQVDVETIKSGK